MKRFGCGYIIPVMLFAPVIRAQSGEMQFPVVKREIVEERLKDIPRKNQERKHRLLELFRVSGCPTVELHPVRKSHDNVICTLPGESDSTILVGAHFDTVADSFGVVDNWSGASLLPSLQEALAAVSRRHTFLFVGFAEEEKGLVGSRHLARQLKKVDEKPELMVNLDTVGLGTTSLWASRSDDRLVERAIYLSRLMKIPIQIVNIDQVGSSDSESFRRFRVPVITFHSVTQPTFPILHTLRDNEKALDRDALYETYRLVVAYLSYLDRNWPIVE